MIAVRRFIRLILAKLWLARGLALYRRGRLHPAAECLQTSLALCGPAFLAHLHLGKIFLRLGRFDRARRELAVARFIDAERFAAQGLPEDVLLEMAERFYQPLWRRVRGPRSTRDDAEAAFSADRAAPLHHLAAGDDFSSADERERFRVLPPIQRDEIESVDWEQAKGLLDE